MARNLLKQLIPDPSSSASSPRTNLGTGLFWVILAALTAVHVITLWYSGSDIHGDVKLYHRVITSIWAGNLPYRDFDFEYPPYVLLWFLLPGYFATVRAFQVVFGLEILLADLGLKAVLIWLATRQPRKCPWLLPVLLFTLATSVNYHFYLQRFDLIPAAISIALLLAFGQGKYFLAGALTVLGIGCKLYPVLFVPPLLLLAYRLRRSRAFGSGLVFGLLPLLILGFFLPWWRFLAFHADRGLQAESLYASLLWFASQFGFGEPRWMWVKAWFEIDSPLNPYLVPIAQALFVAGVFYAEAFVCWRAWRLSCDDLASVARLLLIPLTAFIAFNLVLSPQYLFWTAGLAAVAVLDGRLSGPLYLIFAAIMIPVFYPCPNYGTGFDLAEATALLLRNLLLIVALVSLVRELWPRYCLSNGSPGSLNPNIATPAPGELALAGRPSEIPAFVGPPATAGSPGGPSFTPRN